MPETIQINFSIRFPGGLTVTEAQTVTIEAYDKVEVVIPRNTEKTVQVQPATKGQIKFLLIKAEQYGGLSYLVRGPEADVNTWILLDSLQVFSSAGLLSLLPESPVSLVVKNQADQDRTIQVLVGREAIAVPADGGTGGGGTGGGGTGGGGTGGGGTGGGGTGGGGEGS